MKLSEALQGFWLMRHCSLADDTRCNYNGRFKQFVAYIGDPDFEAITTADIRAVLDHERKRGMSDRTVYDLWVALSTLWTWANKELGIPHVIRGRNLWS